MIRVVVIDEDSPDEDRLTVSLEADGDVAVVGHFRNEDEAREGLALLQPDVVVLDVGDAGVDPGGAKACALLRKVQPHVRVIAISESFSDTTMMAALSAGAKAFLLKDTDPVTLSRAVHGEAAVVDMRFADRLVGLALEAQRSKGHHGLTAQETRIAELLREGLSNREISDRLGLRWPEPAPPRPHPTDPPRLQTVNRGYGDSSAAALLPTPQLEPSTGFVHSGGHAVRIRTCSCSSTFAA